MAFVVKATSKKSGNVTWLAMPDERGFHTFATRKMAATFPNVEDAETAINDTRRALLAADLVFVIESAK